MTFLRRDVVILACAISAGIHGALAPGHFAEGIGAGGGFVAATVVLALLAIVLTRRPNSRLALAGAVGVFVGLIEAMRSRRRRASLSSTPTSSRSRASRSRPRRSRRPALSRRQACSAARSGSPTSYDRKER
jgi:hypothetical protein